MRLQVVCKLWYNELVPQVMQPLTIIQVYQVAVKLEKLLSSMPVAAGYKQTNMWKWVKPLTYEQMLEYWRKVEDSDLMTDTVAAEYAKWQNELTCHCEGMRHRISGREHGIVRWHSAVGTIAEATYKDGR